MRIKMDTSSSPRGKEGWVFVERGLIDASPKSLLNVVISAAETRVYNSNNHKGNLIECIHTRRDPVAPAEIGHRSASACIIGFIAMQLQRPLHWDPEKEQFTDDEEANRMLNRPYRTPWNI